MVAKSNYLKNDQRLTDVIAAIQVLATYKFYKLSFKGWADRISGNEEKAEYWEQVFKEHPEFFRIDSEGKSASLVWRRTYPKDYDVDEHCIKKYSKNDLINLPENKKNRTSRRPLGSKDIEILINTAINLHSRAIESKRERRWWITVASSFVGALLGALAALLTT